MNSLKLEPAPLFALAILCLFLFTLAAIAQHMSGALEGRVVDPNGASVMNAQVKLRNVSTNAEINTTTNESGAFSFRNLEPGEYEVAIVNAGLFTGTQLRALGATINAGIPISPAPVDQVGLDLFSSTDVRGFRVNF